MIDIHHPQPPPPFSPGTGREHYLPEKYYFFDTREVSVLLGIRVTAHCVVRWCDNYVAVLNDYFVDGGELRPGEIREGPLPVGLEERHRFLNALFAWADRVQPTPNLRLDLLRGDQFVLYDEGVVPTLVLSPAEFAELQDCWAGHGLPRDLYYPASAQRSISGPIRAHGGVVCAEALYTPRQAAVLETSPRKLRVPSERKRDETFLEIHGEFLQALDRRLLELQEPGKEVDQAEIEELRSLHRSLIAYAARVLDKLREHPNVGSRARRR